MQKCRTWNQNNHERSTDDGDANKRLYHNRVDDGFVFFDCESYASLPKECLSPASPPPTGDNTAFKNIVCCLSCPTNRKVHMIMTLGPPCFQTLVRGNSNSVGGSGGSNSDLDGGTTE